MKFSLQSLKDGWKRFVENNIVADEPPEMDIEAVYGWTIYQINKATGDNPQHIYEHLERMKAFDPDLNINATNKNEYKELIERYCAHTGREEVPFHFILNGPS